MSKKPWSISTTIRNPKRVVDFIKVLSQDIFQEREYNKQFKLDFERELIRNLDYKPINLSKKIKNKYIIGEKLKQKEAIKVMDENPQSVMWEGRAKTHLKPIRELGFISINSDNQLEISQHGKDLLNNRVSINRVFLKVMMKWQYPSYFRSNRIKIKPFVAILKIVDKVNERWKKIAGKSVGISKEELGLFVLTTMDYHKISDTVDKIINFRQKRKTLNDKSLQSFKKTKIKKFYGNYTQKKEKTLLKDYPDNIFRYFTLTDLFRYRGGRRYIDFSKLKMYEIKNILEHFSPKPVDFNSKKAEVSYKNNSQIPSFPWENNLAELKKIYKNKVKIYNSLFNNNYPVKEREGKNIDEYIGLIKNIEKQIKLKKINKDSKKYFKSIPIYLKGIKKIRSKRSKFSDIKPSLRLEYLVSNILIGLNDALKIKPNYISDEEGWPTFHAPGGMPDIEAYYENFNLILEVTLLRSRDQIWKNEPQPVIRHLENFEKQTDKETFCIFVAPVIHEDTLNYFWFALKGGFQKPQNILPLSIEEFLALVEKFHKIGKKEKLNHIFIKETFKRLLKVDNLSSPLEWRELKRGYLLE